MEEAHTNALAWSPSHIDDIFVKKFLELAEREARVKKLISWTRMNDDNRNFDDDELLKIVMENWVEGIIFKKDGQRHIIGKDVDLCSGKGGCSTESFLLNKDSDNRYFYMRPRRTLKQIDHTGKKKIALRKSIPLYQHKFEGGWFLPQTNPHHILKFPEEIIEKILGYLVQVLTAGLAPQVITCNWRRVWMGAPTFEVHRRTDDWPVYELDPNYREFQGKIIQMTKEDDDDSLVVLRRVHEAEIDAAVLRVCRKFNNIGGNLLYGHNRYIFTMTIVSSKDCPGSWLGNEVWKPPARKPYLLDGDRSAAIFRTRINRGIAGIRKKVYIKRLAGWVYYDRFLRFLYTTGIKNAALIRTLEFSGKIRCHQCERGHHCDDCLLDSLRVYIPFINEFCSRVDTLILYFEGSYSDQEMAIFDDKAQRFFEYDIRQLRFITKLVVFDAPTIRDSDVKETMASRIAEPAIEFFRNRRWNEPMTL